MSSMTAFSMRRADIWVWILLHYVSIAMSDLSSACAGAQLRQHRFVEIAQPSGALGIRADTEKLLLESQIGRQSPGKLECNRRIEIERCRLMLGARKLQNLEVQRYALFTHLPRRRSPVVAEEVDFRLKEITRIVEHLNLKALVSVAQDVETTILVFVHDANDLRDTADHGKAFPLCSHDTKAAVIGEAFSDHLFVAFLKNMQGQRSSRKENDIQRK